MTTHQAQLIELYTGNAAAERATSHAALSVTVEVLIGTRDISDRPRAQLTTDCPRRRGLVAAVPKRRPSGGVYE